MIILISILLILSIALCIFFKLRKEKYKEFILNNSTALNQLLKINEKYHFFNSGNYNESYIYDNYNYYDSISCEDYLIYQLRENQYKILDVIKKINKNKENYDVYCNEINSINCFGTFKSSTKQLNNNLLCLLEKKMFNEKILKPITTFRITVKLYCSKINGYIYDSKSQVFNSEQIASLIKRLNNKNREFYNDSDIWNALCRVERGKVSNKMRFSIYERDGYKCKMCGRSGFYKDLEIDHIKPISKGGKSTYNNLQTLCKRCNKEKSNFVLKRSK